MRRALLVLPLLLAACSAVGPDYGGAPTSTAAAVTDFPARASGPGAESVAPSEPVTSWWRQLGDSELDELMARAVAANYDVRVALANLAGARAVLQEAETRRRPGVSANGNLQRQRGSSAALVFADPDVAQPDVTATTWSLDLAWEVDLFGRVQRSVEAAAADLGSLEALRNDVLVSVLGNVARAYVDLRGAQVRLAVAQRNVGVQRQTLELVSVMSAEGAATELDVARSRTLLLTSEASMPRLEAAVQSALNRLTTLCGEPPGAFTARLGKPGKLPAMPVLVAVGNPADLLRRRPDIGAAERSLAAATARIGVATADLFPTVSFGGRVGIGAAGLPDLAASGAPLYAVGPSLTWNLFDREAIYARIRQADSAAEVAMARYEATVTTALEETDTAISAWLNERVRRTQLAAARTASDEASHLARLRYREGVEDFLTVLDAERSLLAVEDELAQSEIQLAQSLIDIHLALGGGWQDAAAATP